METITVTRVGHSASVAHVELSRPKQGNAMSSKFFTEFRETFKSLGSDTSVRAIVVSAQGKYFSVGLDLKDQDGVMTKNMSDKDMGRKIWDMNLGLAELQETFTAMEQCPQPVIVCMHNACIGGAVDLACAADIRYCSEDAWLSIKKVDIGLAADLGTLQRLHHTGISSSLARELCYTARKMDSAEMLSSGLFSKKFASREATIKAGLEIAEIIASKSPVAIASTKVNLNYSRDHTVSESLRYMATWNSGMLQTEDIMKAAMASISKTKQPDFSNL